MGFFRKKEEKPFISNNSLVEIINSNDAYLNEGIDEKGYSALEKQLERRFLYRNVESVISTGNASLVIVKYKDLKVRSEFEVKQMRENLRKEAGLDIERWNYVTSLLHKLCKKFLDFWVPKVYNVVKELKSEVIKHGFKNG